MSSLETVQNIIELIQKRPLVSLTALICLILIIFSPVILKFSPAPQQDANHQEYTPYESNHEAQNHSQPYDSPQPPVSNQPQNSVSPLVIPSSNTTVQPYTQSTNNSPLLSPSSLFSKDKYFIVVASRSTAQSAIEVATSYANHFQPEVYQTPNGWYAVTIGHFSLEEAKRIQAQETLTHAIPQSSWLSTGLTPGKEWVGKVYP